MHETGVTQANMPAQECSNSRKAPSAPGYGKMIGRVSRKVGRFLDSPNSVVPCSAPSAGFLNEMVCVRVPVRCLFLDGSGTYATF